MYLKFNKDRYYIPDDIYDRWMYWQGKINTAQVNNNNELMNGAIVAFATEFEQYRVNLKKGSIWVKNTDKYVGSRTKAQQKGTVVKLIRINGEFVCYKVVKKVWKFNIGVGDTYCLNAWSFLNIFEMIND